MLTDNDLAAIRARANEATPGEWSAGWGGNPDVQGKDAAGPFNVVSENRGAVCFAVPYQTNHAATWEQVEANLRFIAHARDDIPALLNEIERLRDLLIALAPSTGGVRL